MKTKKLIITLYTSIIALSTLGLGFSVAWYASSSQLSVSAINIGIDGSQDILINTVEERETAVNELDYNLKDTMLFSPVTSAYSSDWRDIKKATPTFYDETLSYSVEENHVTRRATNYGFYSERFYLYSKNDVYVTIDPNEEKTFLKPNALFNNAYAQELYNRYHNIDLDDLTDEEAYFRSLTVEELKDRLDKLVNAMRFSILVPSEDYYRYGIIDPNHNEEEVLYGGLLDNNIDRYYDYYITDDGNTYKERLYGEYNDKSLIKYDEAEATDSDYEDIDREPNAFNAKHKAEVKRVNLADSFDNGLEIKKEESFNLSDFALSNKLKPFVIPVHKDEPQEIILSIYIEGWDLDSVNYTMGATFDASLTFKVDRNIAL